MTLFHLPCYSDFPSKYPKALIKIIIPEFWVDFLLPGMDKIVDFFNILQQNMKKEHKNTHI